jgi:hypothetical protein
MSHGEHESGKSKISPQFARRLARLKPGESVRAVVLLRLPEMSLPSGRRQSRAERQAAIAATERSAEAAVAAVDAILDRTGGQRLSPHADVLGSIAVATSSTGIHALAASEHVKAVLEDQEISPLSSLK